MLRFSNEFFARNKISTSIFQIILDMSSYRNIVVRRVVWNKDVRQVLAELDIQGDYSLPFVLIVSSANAASHVKV